MEPLQEQVVNLNRKVDALHDVVDRLCDKISHLVDSRDVEPHASILPSPEASVRSKFSHKTGSMNRAIAYSMEHKDVLSDDSSFEGSYPNSETCFTPEIQIQRLTAQLTAAYNRIAALEEQLLAQRTHH